MKRRNLIAATVGAAVGGPFGAARSQTAEGAASFRNTFGTPNYEAPSESLKFLNLSQQIRVAVPRDVQKFDLYLNQLPIIERLSKGNKPLSSIVGITDRADAELKKVPELYHLIQWNAFALDMTSLDHATTQPPRDATGQIILPVPPDPLFAEQIGPHRSSRALAMVHLAMFEAINTIANQYQSYKDTRAAILAKVSALGDVKTASMRAATAAAASKMLITLYPNKKVYTDLLMLKLLPLIEDSPVSISLGLAIGNAATDQILLLRKWDGANFLDGSQSNGDGGLLTKGISNSLDLEPEATNPLIYPVPPTSKEWQVDPITMNKKALGAFWKDCEPFVLDPASLFIPAGPPGSESPAFVRDYTDVRRKGGDPNAIPLGARHKTPTTRTGMAPNSPLDNGNETFVANFWAYDGTALLCAPPRLYNMIATSVAIEEHKILDAPAMARYLALLNVVLADCGVAAWTAKYQFKLARPVTYIRKNEPDMVADGVANRDWTPLGAPVSNGSPDGANMTPPFPSYPSGHAVFGGGLFTAMKSLVPIQVRPYEKFSFVSDEYNGLNRGPIGERRPFKRRDLDMTSAMAENARSRIYLGIHWQFDGVDGVKQGADIAQYILAQKVLAPL